MTELKTTYEAVTPYDRVLQLMVNTLTALHETRPGPSDRDAVRYDRIITDMEKLVAYYQRFIVR